MRFTNQTIRTVLLHTLIWVVFATYEQTVRLFENTMRLDLPIELMRYLLNALLFYTNSFVLLPRLYARRRVGAYLGAVLLALLLYLLLYTAFYYHVMVVRDPALAQFMGSDSLVRTLLEVTYQGSFYLLVGSGYWFARHAVGLERQKRTQEQQLRLTERSLLEANLTFLKNQINPHFLFNSLNFLYAQAYPLSRPIAQGLLLLSDTMRYALHEDYQGKVMLTQEVQHVQNYIALNQLRFHDQLQVQFEVAGTPQFALILPLVLITFVENCFKHGELHEAADPLRIHLAVVRNQLTFRTRNKKRLGPKEQSGGIGLANTRQRLALAYPGRHALTVDDGPQHYTCSLTIDL